jgi:phosphatidylglycerophosphate synthase
MPEMPPQPDWRTKPTDRFILKWIKCQLSARITPRLVPIKWLRPWMITLFSAGLGILAGSFFALGWAFTAGLTAALSQILDGVDGQFARLTDRQSKAGAFMDSVIDRYADGTMVVGVVVYLVRFPVLESLWVLLVVGTLAIIGSSQISYSSARAETLGLDLGRPTLVSKGTRVSMMALSGLLTPLWHGAPAIALFYLALHSNLVIVKRLRQVCFPVQAEAEDG